jgi:hypothetical protein
MQVFVSRCKMQRIHRHMLALFGDVDVYLIFYDRDREGPSFLMHFFLFTAHIAISKSSTCLLTCIAAFLPVGYSWCSLSYPTSSVCYHQSWKQKHFNRRRAVAEKKSWWTIARGEYCYWKRLVVKRSRRKKVKEVFGQIALPIYDRQRE